MRFRVVFSLLVSFITCADVKTQELFAINAAWSDSFSEWSYITAKEEEGTLGLRWLNGNDWTEWVFDFDGLRGTLQMKWADDPNTWELRSGGVVVNIRTKWKNDFSEWRISDGTTQLSFRSKYTNSISEWRLVEKRYGNFSMQTEWENDPRDWNIYDELDETISLEAKLAMTFIAVINSIPRS